MSRVVGLTDSDNWKKVVVMVWYISVIAQFFASADIVVEAVPEKVDLKHKVSLCLFTELLNAPDDSCHGGGGSSTLHHCQQHVCHPHRQAGRGKQAP